VFLETNVRSVYIHTFFPAAASVDDAALISLVEQTLDRSSPRQWYYALMDYGSMLKKKHTNPSRRSACYARQSRFEGSDRQVRGALLRNQLRQRRVTFLLAHRLTACEPGRLEKILSGLVRDGLITRTHNRTSHATDVYAII
jgi:A/G-specific adenine glycosylase